MAIEVRELRGNDTLAGGRIVINENIQILASAINVLLKYVNTESKTIKDMEYLSIVKGTGDIPETLITTNGSIRLGGNLYCASGIEATSVSLSQNLNIKEGGITLENPNATFMLNGDFKLDGEFVLTDYTTTKLDAANFVTFENMSGNDNLVYNGQTPIAGKISPRGRSAIVISWESWQNTYEEGEEQFYLNKILLKTGLTNMPVGQVIKIIALINEDKELPYAGTENAGYWILRDCIEYTTNNPITKGIKFDKAWQNVELVYNGTNWVVTHLQGAQIV